MNIGIPPTFRNIKEDHFFKNQVIIPVINFVEATGDDQSISFE
jgi:hypothetical protein